MVSETGLFDDYTTSQLIQARAENYFDVFEIVIYKRITFL